MTTPTIAEILKCANLQMVAVLMSAYPKPDRQQWAQSRHSPNLEAAAHLIGRRAVRLAELLSADHI